MAESTAAIENGYTTAGVMEREVNHPVSEKAPGKSLLQKLLQFGRSEKAKSAPGQVLRFMAAEPVVEAASPRKQSDIFKDEDNARKKAAEESKNAGGVSEEVRYVPTSGGMDALLGEISAEVTARKAKEAQIAGQNGESKPEPIAFSSEAAKIAAELKAQAKLTKAKMKAQFETVVPPKSSSYK